MSYLSERSLILENWMVFAPIFLLIATYIYMKENGKGSKDKNVAPSNDNTSSLAESEYIGEYQEENASDGEEYKPFLKDDEHVPFPGAKMALDGGAAKFYEIANDRRSVRKFSSTRKVDISVIEKCIHAAGKRICFIKKLPEIVNTPGFSFRYQSEWRPYGTMDILCSSRSDTETEHSQYHRRRRTGKLYETNVTQMDNRFDANQDESR